MVVCNDYNVSGVDGNDEFVIEAAHVKVVGKNFRFVVGAVIQCIFCKVVLHIVRRHLVLRGSRQHDFGLAQRRGVVIFGLKE